MPHVQRVYVTWAPSNAAACKACGTKFSKGECKVALCTPSPWHAGLDSNFYHLRCCQKHVLAFSSANEDQPPEFFYKLSAEALQTLHAASAAMLPQCTVPAATTAQRRTLDDALWRLKLSLQELPAKALKEMLDVNSRYSDEDFKGPKLAAHCAQGVMFGSTDKCPACSQRALMVCPFLSEVHCEGNVDGSERSLAALGRQI